MSRQSVPLGIEACRRDSIHYEMMRKRYHNGFIPNRYPAEILIPSCVEDVAAAMKKASQAGTKVGVRSGGHQWTASGMLQDGILLDMQNVNHEIIYDASTETITFGPSCNGLEMSKAMLDIGRFFPHGHTGTVSLGGFLAAGGQGWFFRGWGLTCESWILQIEVVTANGDILICNGEQNADLFWAARGSGQGFFAVVTKYWGRTIPARQLYQSQLVFHGSDGFEEILDFLMQANDATPKEGTDTALVTFYPDKYIPSDREDIKDRSKLVIALAATAYTDSLESAQKMLAAYSEARVPERLKKYLAAAEKTRHITWGDLFKDQDGMVPLDNGERWQCGSILTDPARSRAEIIKAIKPAMVDLPTRQSTGCFVFADIGPDEKHQAASLPQKYYVASMVCWKDTREDAKMHQWLAQVNDAMKHVALGVYVADFNLQFPVKKVISDSAFARYSQLRKKWDPKSLFQGFRGLNSDAGDSLWVANPRL
ncbi:oxidoreductase, FAD-binding protein [Drepanopeziza brunnea f. sp. 'multigermtubi' MB_m1]|uniref:Oxidoreductase, FAD-binding protein n=1 Tax=Marssonina brunnea f. sp. multigermtubi (strain MB_m1) TaxID=1072389 RepID=K1WKW9_MARBU|nr:oxidoreductase, FAD-binding protein [Drepanopeziza brunnea f. sp. 'multigermtubi' MB_m1]EKD18345.1 oxidoreductase, FAD-binding protein [Drepanopeziza brunnea f. sp. 'multigermtubi' MB_m1]